MKKIIYYLSIAVTVVIAAFAIIMPCRPATFNEGDMCLIRGARGESSDINIYCETSAVPSQKSSAWSGDSEDELKSQGENTSDLDRVMNKDASTAQRSELLASWKTYVNEYCRSITEGGKNSTLSSANLFKNWRDALRPPIYA
jgi:hypothetical protein